MFMLAISLIIVGILLRFLPHAANFTPVAAIALFGGATLSRKQALAVPLALMIASDLFLGLHNVVLFTWGGFLLITLLGFRLQRHRGVSSTIGASFVSSFVFFVVSNFGVWLMGWYPRTASGLLECYLMALPFFRDLTVSTLLYTTVLFGAYESITVFARQSKLARVLLNK
jgi:hypothetical protein